MKANVKRPARFSFKTITEKEAKHLTLIFVAVFVIVMIILLILTGSEMQRIKKEEILQIILEDEKADEEI